MSIKEMLKWPNVLEMRMHYMDGEERVKTNHGLWLGTRMEWAATLLHEIYEDFVASNEDVKSATTSLNTC